MPRSSPFVRKPIVDLITKKINTKKLKKFEILDLGMGCGFYGKLIKQKYLTRTRITGVEIWDNYKNEKWDYYDQIILGDIRDYIKRNKKKFDIILLIDVIEHFNQKDGINIIKKLITMTKDLLIVSTPVTNYPQGTRRGNVYEEHKYFWSEKEFMNFGFKKIHSMWFPTINKSAYFFKTLWPLFAKIEVYVFEKF